MEKLAQFFGMIVIALGGLVLLSFLISVLVWLLWNGSFVGAITGVNEITWLQAWGISLLFGLLFKSNYRKSNET